MQTNRYFFLITAQMAVGTKFHSTLKNYFTQPRSQLRIEKEVEGVWSSVADVLKSISSPKAIESNVVHPDLKYRGIFDAIADYEDKPTLIEWKKSDKPRKSILLTYDNPVQLAAYFGAVSNDLNYKHLNVRDALLVIAYTDGSKADAYHLTTDKLREHWAQWLIRLEEYMRKYGKDGEKILQGGKRLFEEDIEHL
ncbi:mitochondrial genome maintenance exonuclease 1-like [Hyposmocoma kahamanoa]|uniref:mitochondrial genome maintenance exonuclease 1-like n=1 Tax=Hyposmocoma kahamanoa TaxID=1477025 RepID=UPI000E6D8327|nr:mitochondrial genome maintenance exonuclease 1-like [Hyposmocoma kahamanoa]